MRARDIPRTEDTSRRNWTIRVSELGKVSDAEVTMSPLVMLVGRNNSGKSYLASAIWSVSNVWDMINPMWDLSLAEGWFDRAPLWYKEFSQKVTDGVSDVSVTIDAARAQSIYSHVNRTLREFGSGFLSSVFRVDNFSRTKLSIFPDALTIGISITATFAEISTKDDVSDRSEISIFDSKGALIVSFQFNRATSANFYLRYIYAAAANIVLYGGVRPTADPMYIPAARTGLMLSLGALTGGRNALGMSNASTVFPRPIADFLERASEGGTSHRPRISDVADWLESETLDGAISRRPGKPDLFYRPSSSNAELPMYAASSMITELAPFLTLLREDWQVDQIIFEEPEAHLHLAAQRSMARALARLINGGSRVLLTTHSDTFVQQINNLMQISASPNRAELLDKFGYEEEDLIDPSIARAYEFVKHGHETHVVELAKTDSGFIIPSLNDTLISLADETLSIQDEGDR